MNDTPKRLADFSEFSAKPWLDAADGAIPCQEVSDKGRLCQDPLVSVVMITYNHERFIAEAIESVLRQQTDFPFELMVGEDASTDSTRKIVMEYQQRYPEIIRVAFSPGNVGIRANAKRSMALARGSLMAHCEGDDAWLARDKLQRQAEFLLSHDAFVLVYTGVRCWSEATDLTSDVQPKPYDARDIEQFDLPRRLLRFDIFLPTVSVMHRAGPEVMTRVEQGLRGGGGAFIMGDFPFFMELASVGQFKYFPEKTALYRSLRESASHSVDAAKMLRYFSSELGCFRYYMDRFPIPADDRADVLERLGSYDLRIAFAARSPDLARLAYDALKEVRRMRLRYRLWHLGATSRFARALLVQPMHQAHLTYWRMRHGVRVGRAKHSAAGGNAE